MAHKSPSQETVKLSNGKRILVMPNKTWEYEDTINLKETSHNEYDSIMVSYFTTIFKEPSTISDEVYVPKGHYIKLIDINSSFIEVSYNNKKIGFINSYSTEVDNEIIKKLQNLTFIKHKEKGRKLVINNILIDKINSAGLVSFYIDWFNLSDKTIKYIYFTVLPYNAVGDIVKCDVKKHSLFTGKVTGPIVSDKSETSLWEGVWYNNTIRCIKLTKVKVIYTDNSSYTYVNELPKIISETFKNNCK